MHGEIAALSSELQCEEQSTSTALHQLYYLGFIELVVLGVAGERPENLIPVPFHSL
jgi:hypothetical protein